MKKLFLISFLLFTFFYSYSQADSTKVIYCEIVGSQFLGKVTITIDMGESKGFLGLNQSYIMDEKTGKQKKFNSMVDAMNFMGENNWDLAQAYVVTMGNTSVYHFLLKQTLTKSDDGNYYPVTRKAFKSEGQL